METEINTEVEVEAEAEEVVAVVVVVVVVVAVAEQVVVVAGVVAEIIANEHSQLIRTWLKENIKRTRPKLPKSTKPYPPPPHLQQDKSSSGLR